MIQFKTKTDTLELNYDMINDFFDGSAGINGI